MKRATGRLGPQSIVAVKKISDPLRDGLVYLGHFVGGSGAFPGVWTSRRNATLPSAAEWSMGGVGDLLAVALATGTSDEILEDVFGRVIALYQDGRYTHLGIVRSRKAVDDDRASANPPYCKHIWVEVIGLVPQGVIVDPGVALSALPWNGPGGKITRIDEVGAFKGGSKANQFRRRLWDAFGIDCPADVRRPARRP